MSSAVKSGSDESFGLLLRKFFQTARASAEEALKPSGYSMPQYGVLMSVKKAPGLTSAELARRFMITPQASGELLAAMEKAGLVERRKHPENARMQAVYLTKSGYLALEDCLEAMQVVEKNMLSRMSAVDKKNFARLLSLAVEGLSPSV